MIGAAGAAPRPFDAGDQELLRADVEVLWSRQRRRVVSAFRNFAALRFIRLPVDSAAERVIEKPLRDLVNDVGRRRGLDVAQRRIIYGCALLALGRLPLGMALPSPFGIIDEVDGVVACAPELASAIQEVWATVDDPQFWMTVSRQCM